MRFYLSLTSCLTFFLASLTFSSLEGTRKLSYKIHSEAGILINAETGQILFEKNAYQPRYPTNISKVATALFAIERNRDLMDMEVIADQECLIAVSKDEIRRSNYTLPPHRLGFGGTHMGIKRGEKLPLETLLYGLMLASANDAANVIAQFTSGSIPKFMDELNIYLTEIGCRNTYFKNPHGLHHPDHKTTAYDLAIITRKGLQDPLFKKIVSTLRYTRPKTNKQDTSTIIQLNKLLKQGPYYYTHAIGVKTGYSNEQGSNLIAAATYEGRTLIAVLLNCKSLNAVYEDAIGLFDEAFAQPVVTKTLLNKGAQSIRVPIEGVMSPVETLTEQEVTFTCYPAEEPEIKACLIPSKKTPPLRAGEEIGTLIFKNEQGDELARASLLAD